MTPVLYKVVGRHQEAADVTTLTMAPVSDAPMAFLPGQFNMLTAFGVGEAAISISSAPHVLAPLEHTVRAVGPVTSSLCSTRVGGLIGVRGPFGTDWGTVETPTTPAPHAPHAGDLVVIAGGIGVAPLRGAVRELMARRDEDRPRIFVIVGARDPSQIVFSDELESWARAGANVAVTVDVPTPGWTGHVGLVTSLLANAGFDPVGAVALVCGPEIMMRFTARALVNQGVDPARIRVSMERNMQCAVAWCGHCQLGPLLVCRDGPVVPYAGVVSHLFNERER